GEGALAAAEPGGDGRLLHHRARARGERLPGRRGADRRRGAAAPAPGPQGLLPAEAGGAAARLPHLGALVRVARLPPQQAGGPTLRARAGAERGARSIEAGTRVPGGRKRACMRTRIVAALAVALLAGAP